MQAVSKSPQPGMLVKLNRSVVIPNCNEVTLSLIRENRLDQVRTWRIHIFINSTNFTKDSFMEAITEIHPLAHIYLHVWKCHVDTLKLLEHSKVIQLPNVRIVRENPSIPVNFAIPCYYGELLRTPNQEKGTYRPLLSFRYHDHGGAMYTSCEVVVEYMKTPMQYYCDFIDLRNKQRDDFPFRTHATKVQPELFREEIIERFKQVTPPSILKGFKDDDDIWDFVSNN